MGNECNVEKYASIWLKFMSHIHEMTLMTVIKVQTLLMPFGMENTYIQILMQEILDLKYVTILDKHKFNGKYQNYHKIFWATFYINYLRMV